MPRIAIESPNQPAVLRLIDELDAYQKPLFGDYAEDPLSGFMEKRIVD